MITFFNTTPIAHPIKVTTIINTLLGIKIIPKYTKNNTTIITINWTFFFIVKSERTCKYNNPINIATKAKSKPRDLGSLTIPPNNAPATDEVNHVK